MLAYSVQWHMMEAWLPLIYDEEEQVAKSFRNSVEPSKRLDSTMQKVHSQNT